MTNKQFFGRMLLILAASLLFIVMTSAKSDSTVIVQGVTIDLTIMDNYCKGFEEGWQDGYCFEDPNCSGIPPAPACPTPNVNEDKGYKGGYLRGFVWGKAFRENE